MDSVYLPGFCWTLGHTSYKGHANDPKTGLCSPKACELEEKETPKPKECTQLLWGRARLPSFPAVCVWTASSRREKAPGTRKLTIKKLMCITREAARVFTVSTIYSGLCHNRHGSRTTTRVQECANAGCFSLGD